MSGGAQGRVVLAMPLSLGVSPSQAAPADRSCRLGIFADWSSAFRARPLYVTWEGGCVVCAGRCVAVVVDESVCRSLSPSWCVGKRMLRRSCDRGTASCPLPIPCSDFCALLALSVSRSAGRVSLSDRSLACCPRSSAIRIFLYLFRGPCRCWCRSIRCCWWGACGTPAASGGSRRVC